MELIRIPRAVFDSYWHQPFTSVRAAAHGGVDGLSVAPPKRNGPFNPNRPTRAKTDTDESFAERMAIWEFDANHAYVREGDDSISKGQTMLYQQGW